MRCNRWRCNGLTDSSHALGQIFLTSECRKRLQPSQTFYSTSALGYTNVKLYGCPALPYAFLKFEASSSNWIPVASADAPAVLRRANLSYAWGTNRTKSAADIDQRNASDETSTSFFFSRTIPKAYEEWNYQFKKQHTTSRSSNDCRPSLEAPVDAIFPKGQAPASHQVQLDILESKSFDPEWVIIEDPNANESLWGKYSWDPKRSQACNALTRLADQEDQRLVSWRVFIGDPTGKRMFAPGHMLCDADTIWFFHYVAEPGRVVIVKATTSGEILYRASFAKPDELGGYLGAIMNPTLHARDGYLYFDWWNSNQSGANRHIKRAMKVRFREPPSAVSSQAEVVSR